MSKLVALHHRMTYTYDQPVQLGPHTLRLRPSGCCWTSIDQYRLTVTPEPTVIYQYEDPFGNWVERCLFGATVDKLDFTVEMVADLTPVNPFNFLILPEAARLPIDYSDELTEALHPYLRCRAVGSDASLLTSMDGSAEEDVVPYLVELNRTINDRIEYQPRTDPGVWTPQETLERGVGSCRDTAWLLTETLRQLGFAARFVSGYLIQLDVEVESANDERPTTEDQAALHAWTEVYLPGAGWIGLDPTSGFLTAEGHLPLARSPEPIGAAPVTGSTAPCEPQLQYSMSVERMDRVATA